jgi:hypothetical protein
MRRAFTIRFFVRGVLTIGNWKTNLVHAGGTLGGWAVPKTLEGDLRRATVPVSGRLQT